MLYKSADFNDLTDFDEKSGQIKGYASVFGNVDSDNDIIMKGAYAKTIKENGSRIRYIYQHQMDKPLGLVDKLYEDNRGLAFEATIPPTTLGKDVVQLIKAGVINQNSVGIVPKQKSYNAEGFRELHQVKLFEISAVTMAANDQALITDAKGNVNPLLAQKRYDTLIKIIKKSNISDELGYAIEGELVKLKALTQDTQSPRDIAPLNVKDDSNEIISYILKYYENGRRN